MDVRYDASTGNGCLDQSVQLFVTSDGQLEMPGLDKVWWSLLHDIYNSCESKIFSQFGQVRTSGFFLTPPAEKTKTQAQNSRKNSTFGKTFHSVCKTQEKTKITEMFSSKLKVFQRVALLIPFLTNIFKNQILQGYHQNLKIMWRKIEDFSENSRKKPKTQRKNSKPKEKT